MIIPVEAIQFTATTEQWQETWPRLELSLEAFEYLIGMQAYRQRELMPNDQFHAQFHQALVEAGYGSREAMIDLAQEAKRELAAEH